jgi:thiol-disulfide isomerase/thioredoxin
MKKAKIILTSAAFVLAVLFSLNFISKDYDNAVKPVNNTNNSSNSDKTPEIKAEKWINTDKDLTLEILKGKVVLIEFWTFGCYNCKNTIPKLNNWYKSYKSDSFEMIGIHCPEFDHERDFDNVKESVGALGIEYPVAIDNGFYNWYNYDVHAWPTIFIIDKKGEIRYQKEGEGSYKKTEEKIKELLEE